MNNRLIISAAGSGKSTFIVNESLRNRNERILITTYTEANEEELKVKFIKRNNCIPSNVIIQTWFSFLIQHGVKPYQGTFNSMLYNKEIKGLLLNNGEFGFKYCTEYNGKKIRVCYNENTEFDRHYFTTTGKILSDRLSKFVVKANASTGGEVVKRISRIFKFIYVDEVQDLAGYDLEILKLLFQTDSRIILVGDPRQVTYLTHHEQKYKKYANGKIKDFIINECTRRIHCEIDEKLLNVSHRNNRAICEFSSFIYEEDQYEKVEPCSCVECRSYSVDSEGVFLVKESDLGDYLRIYNPVQLRWSSSIKVSSEYPTYNFGESKGKTFERIVIYPTQEMEKWIYNRRNKLKPATKAKFYVAITRARYSVAIVSNFPENTEVENIQLYNKDIHN